MYRQNVCYLLLSQVFTSDYYAIEDSTKHPIELGNVCLNAMPQYV